MLIKFLVNKNEIIIDPNEEILEFRSHAYLYIEPNKNHFNILVNMFKLNISFFYFDGPIDESTDYKFNSGKITLFYNKLANTPFINLFYNLNYYSKYYEENHYISNKDILKNPSLTLKEVIEFENKYSCKECGSSDSVLVIFTRQKIRVCLICLKKMIGNVLFERAKNMDLENYISRECKF